MDRASRREDAIAMALVAWTAIGLFVDAYYHTTDPTLESFFTPWHALFYSGFAATAAWIIRMTYRRIDGSTPLFAAAPRGYGAALVGLVIFAIGGIGDGIWHTLFGVETSLDALLSPTHLLLFVGLLLIASAPFRAAWSDRTDDSTASWRSFTGPFLSLLWTATFVAFILEYAVLAANPGVVSVRYVPETGTGEFAAAYGVVTAMLTTIILLTPVLLMVRRWHRIPFGSITLLVTVPAALIAVGFNTDLIGVPAVALAGVAGDQLVRAGLRRFVAPVVPIVLWALFFASVAAFGEGVGWPPEIWGGVIFFSGLTGLAIDGLLTAGATTAASEINRKVDVR